MNLNKLFVVSFFIKTICFSQNQINFSELIDKKSIFENVAVLAHDSLEGRNTGEKGQEKAAKFIISRLKEYGYEGIDNNFLQEVKLRTKSKSGQIRINNVSFNFPEEVGFNGFYQQAEKRISSVQVISLNQLDEVSGNNNYVIVIEKYTSVDFTKIPKTFNGILFFFTKDYQKSYFTRDISSNLELQKSAKNYSIKLFIDYHKLDRRTKNTLKSKKKLLVDVEIKLNANEKTVSSNNVFCFIEGQDEVLKKETVVVSAHYDHIGKKDSLIYNGADDNASGSATIMEMARVFKNLQENGTLFKRSILFVWFTGEEHGLLGSESYVENPIIPLKQTVANLNIDMIGRKDSILEKDQFHVYLIGSDKINKKLHEINENSNLKNNLLYLNYKYNDEKDPLRLYYRSDQYNFVKNGVPSIFYFGGFHEDYHKASDEIEKLNFEKIKTISVLISSTLLTLLNVEQF